MPASASSRQAAARAAGARHALAPDDRIRVCHVAMADAWAGAEVQLVSLLGALARIPDLEVSAILLNDGRVAAELAGRGIPARVIPESADAPWSIWQQLARHFAAHPVHVLHTHKYKDNILAGLATFRQPRVRHVRTVHGAAEPFFGLAAARMWLYGALDAAVNRWGVDRVHAVSAELTAQLAARLGKDKVVCIPNGVDLDRLRSRRTPADLRQELALDADAFVIGALGRLAPVKGFDTFIRAADLIHRDRPRAVFLLAGDGPLRVPLEALAGGLGLGTSLRFLGHRDDSQDVLAVCDLLVLASNHEGIPMVVLEAMAQARPVVATRVGGVPEVIEDGRSGLLVPAGDPAALADACRYLMDHPELAADLGGAGRRRVAERFSSDAIGARFANLYRTLAGRTPAS